MRARNMATITARIAWQLGNAASEWPGRDATWELETDAGEVRYANVGGIRIDLADSSDAAIAAYVEAIKKARGT